MLVVTGATGFLGNVLVRTLLAGGAGPVRSLARPTSDLASLAGLQTEIVHADIGETASLASAFTGADTVFHVAGTVSITRGGLTQLRETNVEGTRNVIAACRQARVRRLMYCSSIHAFVVPPRGSCITEDSPVDPDRCTGSYDRSKAEATLLVREAAARGMDVVTVHPTGVVGPYDFRPSPMGELLLQCARGRLPAYVDGAYNFVDVRDVAAGIAAAATKGTSGAGYILAGDNVTVRALMQTVEAVTGTPAPRLRMPIGLLKSISFLIPVYYWATRQTPLFTTYSLDVISSGCDMTSAKAERELGYTARPFRETVEDAVSWFREQGMLEKV
jgi:dihydroflavonol-4-reductase